MSASDDQIPAVAVPVLRGVSHAGAFVVAPVAAALLVSMASSATGRFAAVVYGLGLCALFGTSALYHRWRWNPRIKPLLRRADHCTIFVFIAATYTPIGLLVLSGTPRTVVLASVWAGALAGVALSLFWIDAPRALVAASYVAVGWVAVIALPQLLDRLPAAPLLLIGAGGLVYSLGALVYARKRPDPWPATFGFHEVFHALVIGAAALHFAAIAGWVIERS